jgi:signal transduction histidine kinase
LYVAFGRHLGTAIACGDGAIAFVTLERARGLRKQLTHEGLDVQACEDRGQLQLVVIDELLDAIAPPAGVSREVFDSEVGARVRSMLDRFGHVAAVGEIVDVLTRQGRVPVAIELEQLWNELLSTTSLSLACAYGMSEFASAETSEAFEQICSAHSHVHPTASFLAGSEADEVAILARLQQRALALENEVAERRVVEARLLRQRAITSQLARTLTRRDAVEIAIDELSDLLQADAAIACLVEGDRLEPVAWTDLELDTSLTFPVEPALFDHVSALVDTATTLRAIVPWLLESFQEHSWIALPLGRDRQALGLVAFGFDTSPALDSLSRAELATLSLQLGQAMERARLYETERAARENFSQLDRKKDEFLAILAHELRNPLAPILAAAELLRGDTRIERERSIIERQARHLTRLVDDLLDVSRVTRGSFQLKRSSRLVAPLVNQAVEAIAPVIVQHGHVLDIEIDPGLPAMDLDGDRVEQALSNVIGNAAKYTPNPGRICVAVRRSGSEIVIRVSDPGRGIRPELLPRIFEPFVQGEPAIDKKDAGLGIGLTLARTLIELHGGTIEAASEGENRGSVFSIRLPIVEVAPPSEKEASPGRDVASATRVLVVDDNVDMCTLVAEALGRLGHEVRVASCGDAALSGFREFEPHVVVLDLGLPGLDGLEVARRIRESGFHPRLVAMTGYGQPSDRAATHAAGFDVHLVKPVDIRTLIAAIAMDA